MDGPRAADSEFSPQLQAADFIVGAIATAARGDRHFVEILEAGGVRVAIR